MSWDAVLIAGPTASGKSALALQLAERIGGAVINADSMQVYAELRVLTARPTREDEARAPHLLYGQVSVRERYSAGRYQDDAARALEEARAAKRMAIFAGGTGLYFKVLTEGLSPIPAVPAEIRARAAARLAALGAEKFHAEFALRDPETAAGLRASDKQRTLRAASVLEATGRGLKRWQETQGRPVLKGMRVARFVLAPPREEIHTRIAARFARMMEEGALQEARALMDLDPALPVARALGVPQLLGHLRGEMTLEEAVAAAESETRRYAKRQLTWFRRFMSDWKWLESSDLRYNISKLVGKVA